MTTIHRGLLLVATLVLSFALFVFLAYAFNLMTFPFDYDQGEGFELVDTILFSEFRSPYQNTDAFPYYSSNYPPLYHVIAAPFVWVFGDAYWYGRLLSTLSTLIAGGAIYYAVYRAEGHRWIAILAGLAFISSNTVYHIGALYRQHIMMVAFEVVAVVILAHAIPRKQTRSIALGLFLIVLAGYTKQLAAITAIAVLGWLFLRNPRRGVLWGAGFTLVGGAIFSVLTVSTGGEWWRQAILANVNAFNPLQTFGLTLLWLRLHLLLIIPAVLFFAYELYADRLSLYSVWFLFATVLGAIGSGTWGAGDSYFATSIAATCILSGLFFSRTLNNTWSFNKTTYSKFIPQSKYILTASMLVIPALYIGYGVMTFKMPTEGAIFGAVAQILRIEPNVMDRHYDSASYDVIGYANIGHFVTQEDIENGRYIVSLIEDSEILVMSEEAGFSLVANRPVITNPTQLRNLWLNGLWNGEELIADIEAQRYGIIIFRAEFYPTPLLETIGQYYSVSETVTMNGFVYRILRPIDNEN